MALGGTVAGSARVIVGADTRDLDRGLTRAGRDVDDFGRRGTLSLGRMSGAFGLLGKAALPMGAALGVAAVGAKEVIGAASDLNEQISKAQQVFGAASESVLAFSRTTGPALGISQRAALEAAGTFGNMLVPMGFARESAAQMSTGFVQLAADMASFNNASPEETLQALQSGLAGETEPLRRFGVFLNEARIQEEALRSGLIKQGQTLTAAGKAQATYAIIMKDTADTQGDFARTSDGLANQQRILRARFEDVQAEIGQKLLPVMLDLLTFLNERLIPGIQKFAHEWDRSWRDIQKEALLAYRKIIEPMSHLPGIMGSGAREIKEAVNEELAKLSAQEGIDRITEEFEHWDVTVATAAGARVGQAWGAAFLGSAAPFLDALTGEVTPAGGLPGGAGSPTRTGRPANVVLSGGADRPGVATKNIVLQFVSRIGQVAGQDRVVIGTGTAHSRMTSSGNVSQHWTGNAADIPASGAALTRLGQSALIAAGADPEWARRQKGGLYNIGGFQIIFNSNIGGNHFNHLHVGVRDGTEIPGAPSGSELESESQDTIYGVDKTKAKAKAKPKEKAGKTTLDLTEDPLIPTGLRLGVAKAELSKDLGDDLAALEAIDDHLVKRIAKERDVEKRIELLAELKATRERIASLRKEREGEDPEDELIPKALQIRLARAELTKDVGDDLDVLGEIETYLVKRTKREQDINRRLELLAQLKGVRDRIAGVEVPASEAAERFGRELEQAIGATPGEAGTVRPGILGSIGLPAVSAREQGTIDNILHSMRPQLEAWAAYARAMLAKKKEAIKRRNLTKNSLAAARRRPRRFWDLGLIRPLEADLALYEGDIAEADAAYQTALERYGAVEAAMSDDIARAANEDEEAGGGERPPSDTGDTGGGGGGGFAGGGDEGPRVPIVDEAAAAAARQAEIEALTRQNVVGYLTGLRGLRQFQENVFSPLNALTGSTLVVNNYYAGPPPESHAFSKQLEHELRALIA